jgi:hypothetical protein
MKTKNKTPTAGLLMLRLVSKSGKSSRHGLPNLRLELGHRLKPTPMRTTEFAPAAPEAAGAASTFLGLCPADSGLLLESRSPLWP